MDTDQAAQVSLVSQSYFLNDASETGSHLFRSVLIQYKHVHMRGRHFHGDQEDTSPRHQSPDKRRADERDAEAV